MTLHRLATLTVIAALSVVFGATSVDAHEGEGILTVESSTPTATGRDYVVRLTWANDGHPAIDATVTATAIAADGTPGTPVPLSSVDQDGRLRGEVPLPTSGEWTVRITAVTPAALLEVQEQVVTTTSTTTETPPSTSTTTEPDAPTSTTEATASDNDGDADGGIGGAIAVVVLVAIVVGGVVGVARARQPVNSRG